MNRVMLFTTTALFGLAAAGMSYADGAHPTAASTANRIVRHGPSNNGSPCGTGAILYEQDPASTGQADSGIGIVSQDFESAFNNYDARGADDFVVPASGWTISEVDVTGVYFNGSGPAISETVRFFHNASGRPGTLIATYTVTGVDSAGSFCIPIPPTVLSQGHYWMSVVPRMHFSAGGEWGWENLVSPEILSPAHWKNHRNGFGTGCTTWNGVENVCIPDGQGDHIFTLR